MTEPVRVESNNGVLWITLDRPKANAIDAATSQTLYEAFDRLHRDESLRVGVVTGQGQRFFSAGWDLKAAAAGEAVDADHGTGGFAGLTEFFELDKPVIAAVNGMALGGGFELTLAADLVVAAEHAEFALTEATLGMVADSGGVLRLPKRLPTVVAREMLLTGRRMSAAEAHHWGLVNDVVPIDRLAERSEELAHQVCGSAPLAVRAVQEVLHRTSELDVASGYSLMRGGDLPTYQQVLSSADAEEGPQAFAAGRTPQWRGR